MGASAETEVYIKRENYLEVREKCSTFAAFMKKVNMRDSFDKFLNWYFTKKSMPYWCILVMDLFIVFLSGLFVFWMFTRPIFFFILQEA